MKFFKIHRNYLLNKINIIIMIFTIIVVGVIALTSILKINNNYSWFLKKEAMYEYLSNSLLFYKLIIIVLNSYLWGSAFTKEKDSYHLLISDFNHVKFKYLLTKITTLIIISLLLIFSFFIIYAFIGIICSNWYEIDKNIVYLFINYLLIVMIYGLLSIIFSVLFVNEFAYFIAPLFFVFGELAVDNNDTSIIIKIFQTFFPNITLDVVSYSSFGIIHLIILSLFYLVIVIIIYMNKT